MVEVTQTEDEIKINIKLINIKSKSPDIVLLPNYVKFNLHPIFFEGHLTNEIDESNSTCKLFKSEARIILKKKSSGLWDDIFEKLTKAEALERRKAMVDALQAKNQDIEKQLLKRYDDKRKVEINREIERDTDTRKKIETATQSLIEEHLHSDHVNHASQKASVQVPQLIENKPQQKIIPKHAIRSGGKINVTFTNFEFKTPRRESQKDWQAEVQAQALRKSMKIV